ncbi:MAG: DUF4249 domain-containing protein [Cytophagaceae bacterium]|nr:DUF4249 domain-containing protein [Cytophagaceae bacterium]
MRGSKNGFAKLIYPPRIRWLLISKTLRFVVATACLTGCIEPFDTGFVSSVNLIVVEGVITDADQPQFILLSRSKGDSLTGRPGYQPINGARVEVLVDSTQVVSCQQTAPGLYQLPDGFRGRPGHRYQLRFTLTNGTRYASSVETMPAVPPIQNVYDRFNAQSIPTDKFGIFQAANDVFIDLQDPADVRNYYRWDWMLWERQEVCHSCQNGEYYINDAKGNLLEDCIPDPKSFGYVMPIFRDYVCRTPCWEILFSAQLKLFADIYTDGGPLTEWRVAQIPYYQYTPCLVEIRQLALTAGAYRYYKLLDDQTQKTGSLVDTPPAPLVGNVRNLTNEREHVIGYFTASGVFQVRYWLDRRANTGPGDLSLFKFLNGREPSIVLGSPFRGRPPLAVCVPGAGRTPIKPEGWKE